MGVSLCFFFLLFLFLKSEAIKQTDLLASYQSKKAHTRWCVWNPVPFYSVKKVSKLSYFIYERAADFKWKSWPPESHPKTHLIRKTKPNYIILMYIEWLTLSECSMTILPIRTDESFIRLSAWPVSHQIIIVIIGAQLKNEMRIHWGFLSPKIVSFNSFGFQTIC